MSQASTLRHGNNVLVALGGNAQSNVGSPRQTVEAALGILASTFVHFQASRLYQTPAFPAGAGPDFVNAACVFQSDLPAPAILAALHSIEMTFGRTRETRWGERTLDLDLIAVAGDVLPDTKTFDYWRSLPLEQQRTMAPTQLILPHPRMQDRGFVLVPLVDVAPTWRHPVLGQTSAELLALRPAGEIAEVTPL